MREIKFRGWHKGLNKWVYGFLTRNKNGVYFIENEDSHFGIADVISICQYTGLKDKDGREIFEGDLYKFTISHDMYNPESGHTTFEVVHVKAVTFEDGAFYHGTHLLSEIIEFDDSFTYVGNIYENHELLEELQNESK